ncbi:hypothetical protein Bbelb_089210 [Branchiostoma belcheri]|nr:hypothetical protein Bbelb_089210 [Branchiostoma belcheri]
MEGSRQWVTGNSVIWNLRVYVGEGWERPLRYSYMIWDFGSAKEQRQKQNAQHNHYNGDEHVFKPCFPFYGNGYAMTIVPYTPTLVRPARRLFVQRFVRCNDYKW